MVNAFTESAHAEESGMKLITERLPPLKRVGKCEGPLELHLLEAAVMLAMAKWMFGQGATEVEIHPDGQHLKGFDVRGWLEAVGFVKTADMGRTPAGGVYKSGEQTVTVDPRPGIGDVVAIIDGARVEVEAKGGCINTRHPGQLSKLRKHLYEAVGMLLDSRNDASRLIAAVPRHSETERVAERMAKQCGAAGIEIALVSGDGSIWIVE